MIRVAVTNLIEYENNNLLYEWIELPCNNETLESVINKFGKNNYFISDFECEKFHTKIDMYVKLSELNDVVTQISEMNKYDLKIFIAILESHTEDLFDALDIWADENYDFFNVDSLVELAEILTEHGYYGEIPEEALYYIDYKKLARDLNYNGYVETSQGVIIYY